MNIQNIEYFLQLAKYEHVSVTADLLNISQPALSKRIASLEAELGIKLFDRSGNRVVLNTAGAQFAQHARQALDMLDMSVKMLKKGIYDTNGTIEIAYCIYAPILAKCISAYSELNPLANFRIVSMPSSSDLNETNQPDFLLWSSYNNPAFNRNEQFWVTQTLFNERYILIHRKDHPAFLDPEHFQLRNLKNERFVTMTQEDILWTEITYPLCLSAGFYPKIYCHTDEFLVKVKIVEQGHAISLIPESCLQDALRLAPGLGFTEIKDYNTERSIVLMRRKKATLSEVALDFWEFVMEYFGFEPDTKE